VPACPLRCRPTRPHQYRLSIRPSVASQSSGSSPPIMETPLTGAAWPLGRRLMQTPCAPECNNAPTPTSINQAHRQPVVDGRYCLTIQSCDLSCHSYRLRPRLSRCPISVSHSDRYRTGTICSLNPFHIHGLIIGSR